MPDEKIRKANSLCKSKIFKINKLNLAKYVFNSVYKVTLNINVINKNT